MGEGHEGFLVRHFVENTRVGLSWPSSKTSQKRVFHLRRGIFDDFGRILT
jgi:hypothetical protein